MIKNQVERLANATLPEKNSLLTENREKRGTKLNCRPQQDNVQQQQRSGELKGLYQRCVRWPVKLYRTVYFREGSSCEQIIHFQGFLYQRYPTHIKFC